MKRSREVKKHCCATRRGGDCEALFGGTRSGDSTVRVADNPLEALRGTTFAWQPGIRLAAISDELTKTVVCVVLQKRAGFEKQVRSSEAIPARAPAGYDAPPETRDFNRVHLHDSCFYFVG